MAVLRQNEFQSLLKTKATNAKAVLFYGNDAGAVREYGQRLVKAVLDDGDESLNVQELTDDAIHNDHALLADSLGAISMLGGRTIVLLRDAGSGLAECLESCLKITKGDGIIIALATKLRKTDKLVKLFTSHAECLVMPLYEDNTGSLFDLITEITTAANLTIDRDAMGVLVHNLGADRAISRNEIDKLCLYCLGRQKITHDDVIAVIDDVSAVSHDRVIDYALAGNGEEAIRYFQRMLAASTDMTALLIMLANHLNRLQILRSEFDNGRNASMILKQSKPPIFFQRHKLMARAIENWSSTKLDRAMAGIAEATKLTRTMPDLSNDIAERAVFTLARMANSRSPRDN